MQVNAAATSIFSGQLRKTLEAEARAAVSAIHLVALSALRSLVRQILLSNGDLAFGALLRTCFLHPLPKTFGPVVHFSAPFTRLLLFSIGLAR